MARANTIGGDATQVLFWPVRTQWAEACRGFRDLSPSLATLEGIVGAYSSVPPAGQKRRYCLYAHTQKKE